MGIHCNKLNNITIEITSRCNLHCRICSIWKESPPSILNYKKIQTFLNTIPKISSVSLTGGEPFLHPNINQIYRYLYSLYLRKRLSCIDIATNASSPSFISFLKKNKDLLAPLSLAISLDGISETHDRQRGTPGAFKRVVKNILFAKRLIIPITIKFVASALNYRQLIATAHLAKKMGCKFDFKLIERVPAYYHRHSLKQLPILAASHKKWLLQSLDSLPQNPYSGLLEELSLTWHRKHLQSGDLGFIHKCLTPQRTLFITAHEDIYNCLYQEKVGTLATWPDGLSSATIRDNIRHGQQGTCPKCLSYHGSLRKFNADPKH